MIAPYNCVGLIPTVWGIRTRADIMKNIEHQAAAWLSRLDIPVRLLIMPEGGLQGFNGRCWISITSSSPTPAPLSRDQRRSARRILIQ